MQIGRAKRAIEPAAVPLVPAPPLSLPLMASPSLQSSGLADHLPSLMGPLVMSRTLPSPHILLFDSGLGGLTVFREIAKARPDAQFIYAADDAVFPYGKIEESTLIARVLEVMGGLIETHQPDLVVVACNTASTIVLPALRQHFDLPFVGTVPAIKPAAALTLSGRVAVLGTPGTVQRDYTRALIDTYAAEVVVTLVGATGLAKLAEARLKGESIADEAVLAEIAPCFVDRDGRRTDVVTLACTHYPLLLDVFHRVAPWPVTWLDPAPAIARRTADLIGPCRPGEPGEALAVFTSGSGVTEDLRTALGGLGLSRLVVEAMPLALH